METKEPKKKRKTSGRNPGKITEYKGTTFKSKYEASIAEAFDELGIEWEYEPIRLPYIMPVQFYKPDWKIKIPNSNTEFYIESKGYFSSTEILKMKQIKMLYPRMDIRMMFQKPDNIVPPTVGTTYSMWAERHGYDCVDLESLRDMVEHNNKSAKQKRTSINQERREKKNAGTKKDESKKL